WLISSVCCSIVASIRVNEFLSGAWSSSLAASARSRGTSGLPASSAARRTAVLQISKPPTADTTSAPTTSSTWLVQICGDSAPVAGCDGATKHNASAAAGSGSTARTMTARRTVCLARSLPAVGSGAGRLSLLTWSPHLAADVRQHPCQPEISEMIDVPGQAACGRQTIVDHADDKSGQKRGLYGRHRLL